MISYADEKIEFDGCPGCAYVKVEFTLPCGIAYENESFKLSQDWELPIPGFFVISPKRHIETFEELTSIERVEIFELVNNTIKILRENNICDRFNVVFEEKRHFHIWIMPRYKWMTYLNKNIMGNIELIFEYAKNNMRTEENYQNIEEITKIVGKSLQKRIK